MMYGPSWPFTWQVSVSVLSVLNGHSGQICDSHIYWEQLSAIVYLRVASFSWNFSSAVVLELQTSHREIFISRHNIACDVFRQFHGVYVYTFCFNLQSSYESDKSYSENSLITTRFLAIPFLFFFCTYDIDFFKCCGLLATNVTPS